MSRGDIAVTPTAMRALRRIAACFGAIALAAATPARGDVRDDPVGGGGGGAFAARCPFPQILTGLELHVGDDVDAVRPLCVVAYGPSYTSTVWVSSPASAQHVGAFGGYDSREAVSVDRGPPNPGLVVVGDRLWYGGGGGHPISLLCPSYQPALLQLDVEAEGESTVIVHDLAIHCGNAAAKQGDDRWLWSYAQKFTGAGARRYRKNWSHGPNYLERWSRCPVGTVGVGIHGRSGIWLDALGIICDSPHYVPAPPPPPKTTADRLRELPTQETHDGGTRHAGEILAATKGKGVQAVSALASHPADKATLATPYPLRSGEDGGVSSTSQQLEPAAVTGAKTSSNIRPDWSQATPDRGSLIALANTLRLSLTPPSPAANAVATLKAEGIPRHCEGVTLHFGDGTPDEFAPLGTTGAAPRVEHAHRFSRRGTYTIEATTSSQRKQCAKARATLNVVVK